MTHFAPCKSATAWSTSMPIHISLASDIVERPTWMAMSETAKVALALVEATLLRSLEMEAMDAKKVAAEGPEKAPVATNTSIRQIVP